MALQDMTGSLAHAEMLAHVGVISGDDLSAIERGMAQIRQEINEGTFQWSLDLEDVHLNIEKRLVELIGDAGKRCTRAARATTKWPPTFACGCENK